MTSLTVHVTWDDDAEPNVDPSRGMKCLVEGYDVTAAPVPATLLVVAAHLLSEPALEDLEEVPISGDVLALLVDLRVRDMMQHILSHLPSSVLEDGQVEFVSV